jgi:heme/copper-type cytochrome/quinol oxidase subunit 3
MSASAAPVVPEPEDPRLVAANLVVGARLFASAMAFVFMSFVFAFFYLKAVNSNGMWRPHQVTPPQGYGIAILVCILAAAAAFELARRGLASGTGSAPMLGLALGLSVAVVVLQLIAYLGGVDFGADGGGYASVFYGWTAMFLAFWLGAVYSVETLLATSMRSAREAADAGAGASVEALRPSADATMVYLYSCAGIAVVTWVLLYLIK